MIKMIFDRVLDEPRRLSRGEPFLGLPVEGGGGDKQRQQHRGTRRDVFAGRLSDSAIVDQLAISFDAPQQRTTQTGLVSPTFGSRNGIAIGVAEAVLF